MYNFTRMPAMRMVDHFARSAAAMAPKPKTNFGSSTYKTLIRAVKLTVIIMLFGLLQVSARTTAQTRISLKLHGATLEKVFAEIEKRSGYTVFYNTEVLQAAGSSLVSLDVKDATIEDVMHQCLKGLPLEFTVQDKTIFVKKEARRVAVGAVSGPGTPIPSTLSGIVRAESGAPLMGASVYVVKLKKTVATNKDGVFTLKDVPDGDYDVVISFIGYENYRTKVSVSNHEGWLNADMRQSMSKLDETVVKGYYSTTNRLNTGDVTTVKGEDIQKQPVQDPIMALEGRVPGLYIQQTSGAPGAYSTIRVGGQNSIANGSDPLYIVDGVPYSATSLTNPFFGGGMLGAPLLNGTDLYGYATGMSPFNLLNPADIESIEVLKDADATAIYGSRGANGVILITTRKGKAGNTKIDANVYSGAGKVTRKLHLLNTQQYLEMRHEAFTNDGLKPNPKSDYDLIGWDTTRYTDWQKVFIGNSASFTNAQVSISGGSAATQFVAGGGYSDQGTVFPGSYSDKRVSGFLNLTHSSNNGRFHTQMSISYVNDNSNLPNQDLTSQITLAPDAPALYNSNGTLNWAPVNKVASTWNNPMSYTLDHANAQSYNLITNLTLSYQILQGLYIKGNLGYNQDQMDQSNTTPASSYPPPTKNNNPANRTNLLATNEGKSWITEPQLSYEHMISKGKFNALIGATFQDNSGSSVTTYTSGFSSDALIGDPASASTLFIDGDQYTKYRYNALFARIGYDWEDKYLLNLTGRRDGSSRFGPGKQFGNFGAIGAGWIFSREAFVANNLPFLSYGKIRASYGITGNDQIGNYQYLSSYSSNSYTYQGLTGLSPNGLTNPYFAWEQVKKMEVGLDLGILKDRLLIGVNYFVNKSNNQLINYSLPYLSGFSSIQENLPASVRNKGVEVTLNIINVRTKNFNWSTSVNLTVPSNKLLSFPNIVSSSYNTTYAVGHSLFIHYVYHNTGVNPQTGVYSFTTKNANGVPKPPADYIVSKPLTQTLYGGFDNNFTYKGFRLDFLIQFVEQSAYNYIHAINLPGVFNVNEPTYVLSRWRTTGQLTNIERFTTIRSTAVSPAFGNFKSSDAAISDASFLRLKNVQFSYELPIEWRKKLTLQEMRVYIQCQNLFTVTGYKGLDPETQGFNLPPLRMITGGIQVSL